MRVKKVLVVYKKVIRPMRAGATQFSRTPPLVRQDILRLEEARKENSKTLRRVKQVLSSRGIHYRSLTRSHRLRGASYDGVIAVGGDGTFLEASHSVRNQWMLGVNSDPKRSVGYFCSTTAPTFGRTIVRMMEGQERIQRLQRIALKLNGAGLPALALNDILITHRKPSAMSRYWIQIGRACEEQRSSGLWIATPAGSTGAIRSAGGRLLSPSAKMFQYRPRELYRGPAWRYRFTGGLLMPGQRLLVGCLMEEALICVDGEHVTFPFRYGDILQVTMSRSPLLFVKG